MAKKMTLASLILLGLVCGVFFHLNSTAQAQSSTPSFTTSRFAMISGPITVRPELKGGETRVENGVFRIDTYTGTAWMLDVKISDDGSRSATWVPVAGK